MQPVGVSEGDDCMSKNPFFRKNAEPFAGGSDKQKFIAGVAVIAVIFLFVLGLIYLL